MRASWALMFAFAGCTGALAPSVACVEDNPATVEEDFASDMWHIACPAAPTGPAPACDPPLVADIEAQCAAEGVPCAGTIRVGREAAVCVAAAEGLADGLDGLHADLMFHHGFAVPIWSVSNVLEDPGDGSSAGETFSIDAATGNVLQRLVWQAIP